jgi:hypothetical protein
MQHDTTDAQWAHEQELESRRLQEERPLDPREIDERIRQAASILKPVQAHYAESFEDAGLFNEEIAKLWVHALLRKMKLNP